MSIDAMLDTLDQRELQLEAARVLTAFDATNHFIKQFKADHDSRQFYRNVVRWYTNKYKGFPSDIGPASEVKLLYD